jgi:hypothetical protein
VTPEEPRQFGNRRMHLFLKLDGCLLEASPCRRATVDEDDGKTGHRRLLRVAVGSMSPGFPSRALLFRRVAMMPAS